ncbi:MAG: hypothetical protein FWE67_11060, partial [Planctomycetaceae bacterium]|nr:hypothetical protein [Planctomycetaceae bacterium]
RAVTPQECNPYKMREEMTKEPDFYITPAELAKYVTKYAGYNEARAQAAVAMPSSIKSSPAEMSNSALSNPNIDVNKSDNIVLNEN